MNQSEFLAIICNSLKAWEKFTRRRCDWFWFWFCSSLVGKVTRDSKANHVFLSSDLLESDSTQHELEVTYNAGGIISHLAFDGPNNWTNKEVSRDQALQRLV